MRCTKQIWTERERMERRDSSGQKTCEVRWMIEENEKEVGRQRQIGSTLYVR